MRIRIPRKHWSILVFTTIFSLSLAIGALAAWSGPASASPYPAPELQTPGYAGTQACAQCHQNIYEQFTTTFHAKAFSSPIFQQDWVELNSDVTCLKCHTTGYDPATGNYAEEGVTCEACHGKFSPTHPLTMMPVSPDATLCGECHKTTTDEWRASIHSQEGIQCQSCHNPHAQLPKADSITALCTNCHKEMGDTFTHGTHANAGLECSNCHMYTSPRMADPIMGLVPTGHTFAVGSEACIGCHQDTVHTRDEIVRLTGEVTGSREVNIDTLQQQVQEQMQTIETLKASNTVRLYTGLAQGAIIGLVTGGVAAWIVSRRITVIEIEE